MGADGLFAAVYKKNDTIYSFGLVLLACTVPLSLHAANLNPRLLSLILFTVLYQLTPRQQQQAEPSKVFTVVLMTLFKYWHFRPEFTQ